MSYSLVAKAEGGNGDFEVCPPGPTTARCIDLVDLGTQRIEWQGQVKMLHKIDIYWLTSKPKSDGSGLLTVRQRYTLSLNEKSNLYKDLNSWRGRQFTAEELAEFELENLVGAPCFFSVIHRESGGKTYANPTSFMPLPKEMQAPEMPTDYVRHVERENSIDQRSPNYKAPDAAPAQQQAPQGQAVNQYQQGPPQGQAAFTPNDDLPF